MSMHSCVRLILLLTFSLATVNCVAKVINKPGECPPGPQTCAKPGAGGCKKDSDCKGVKKCCRIDCGPPQCVLPVPKPGFCPLFPSMQCPPDAPVHNGPCKYDVECPGDQKCCNLGAVCAGTICTEPAVDGWSSPDPGSCEALIERWYYNSTDQYCHTFTFGGCDGNANNYVTELKCRQACNAKDTTPKPGECPLFPSMECSPDAPVNNSPCTYDADCPEDEKCCTLGAVCAGTICYPPN